MQARDIHGILQKNVRLFAKHNNLDNLCISTIIVFFFMQHIESESMHGVVNSVLKSLNFCDDFEWSTCNELDLDTK